MNDTTTNTAADDIAVDEITVNGTTVDPTVWPTPELAAVHELLRQRSVDLGFLADDAGEPDIERAFELILTEEVDVPEPTEEECRRWYDANPKRYRSGDLAYARHILFQITPGAPLASIRSFAEAMLDEIRRKPEIFAERAKKHSNCPSGANGGQLGQLQRGQTVPEFDKAIFDTTTEGVLPALVKTRYGFHIVSVDKRVEGVQLPYDLVRDQIAGELRTRSEERALSQYVQLLAGNAEITGVELDAVGSPLVQ